MKYLQCFDRKAFDDPERPLLDDGYLRGCIFCDVSTERGFAVEYEDEELIAFRDRWPRAAEHLLIIPRRHAVGTVPELTREHIGLITRMETLAHTLRPTSKAKLGFHIPPFSSVHHLHLHVLVPPYTAMGKMQYPVRERAGGGKGWSWFVTPRQVVGVLEAGGRIGLGKADGRKA